MKIGSTRQVGQAAGKRPASARGAGSGFSAEGVGEGREVGMAGLGATTSLGAVDALLALQEASFVGDALNSPKRAIARGEQMLDMLDDIKLALLSGQVPQQKLSRLLMAVEGQKAHVADPGLANILDHIELRARVELAKFGTFPKE
ncbi:flagellar assembly protein FliX [Parvibaculum sp.]|uniref:flagellar assembly protein FliX n=1 Tax=Parvibaculum sp. TaxID=2024848 RepID=UPI002CB656E6|nr:flagellar assembly protein FliX [Parvibaculum sp.]HUD51717.1 flagellar assembly protein FliX [Parvibaculum sp.]